MKTIALFAENLGWALKCRYNLWLHGRMVWLKLFRIPFRFLIKYLRKYGATIGENCRFERGVRIRGLLAAGRLKTWSSGMSCPLAITS